MLATRKKKKQVSAFGQPKAIRPRACGYIKSTEEEGAQLLIGGEGHPDGLTEGFFVKPTAFAGVTRNMRIAKEEVFGPDPFHHDVQDRSRSH